MAPAGRPRRSRAGLETALASASSDSQLAEAHFELALFHDNNNREAEAIPHYQAALANGIAGEKRAECLAWLASSLYKTYRLEEALDVLQQARAATASPELSRFLSGLERRIRIRRKL